MTCFYRSRLDSGDFEYARIDADHGRAHYFDDELRLWVPDDSLVAEISEEDSTWTPCSAEEVLDAAAALVA